MRGIKLTAKKGFVVAAFMVGIDDEIFVISSAGTLIRMAVRDVSSQGRDATGVRVMNLDAGQAVAAVAPVLDRRRLTRPPVGSDFPRSFGTTTAPGVGARGGGGPCP